MAGHFHAVVWIDHKQARIFHFNVEEVGQDRHPSGPRGEGHSSRREAHRPSRPGGPGLLRGGRQGDRRRGRDPHRRPGAGEKDAFAKFLAEKHPAIRTHVEGVESADHPTDGELLDHARRFVKAADRMRP